MAETTVPSGQKATRSYPVISRREVEAQIADGRMIIILDQYVLKVDAWMKYHPGGDKAIRHMVGRDATDEVTVFVPPHHFSRQPLSVGKPTLTA